MGEAEALDLFLHATQVGLFEMDWHVVCPHCGFVVDSLHAMSQLHTHYWCTICGAEHDHALDDYILVGFSVAPRVRAIKYHDPDSLEVEDAYFNRRLSRDVLSPVEAFPTWRDAIVHVTKHLRYLEPGERAVAEIDLPPGTLRATNERDCIHVQARHDSREEPTRLSIEVVDGRFRSGDPSAQRRRLEERTRQGAPVPVAFDLSLVVPSGRLTLEVQNREERRCVLSVYHTGELPVPVLPLRPSVNGKRLLTSQTFRDLFRSEVVRTNETLTIQDIAFVFTDLKGSTALYEAVGDAKAYFLVRQHFDTLSRVIRERGGAIVKTIGDAVMAVFPDAEAATRAAVEMLDALDALNDKISQELMLKIGIHRGHSMAVTVDDRVDYFGQTVNIAARVQALADANEICLTDDVYGAAGVSEALLGHPVGLDDVRVKGVSEKIRVYRVGRRR
jgi:class 3 adenylate cyclase